MRQPIREQLERAHLRRGLTAPQHRTSWETLRRQFYQIVSSCDRNEVRSAWRRLRDRSAGDLEYAKLQTYAMRRSFNLISVRWHRKHDRKFEKVWDASWEKLKDDPRINAHLAELADEFGEDSYSHHTAVRDLRRQVLEFFNTNYPPLSAKLNRTLHGKFLGKVGRPQKIR